MTLSIHNIGGIIGMAKNFVFSRGVRTSKYGVGLYMF